jgi:hypothetical protein
MDSSMSEHVRMETVRHRTSLCLLTFAVFGFLPLFAYGQCKEPATPGAAVVAPHVGAAVAGAAQARPASAGTEFGKPPARAAVPMVYNPHLIEVPDLSNRTVEEVRAEVANKLVIRNVKDNNPGWIVLRQFPGKNSHVQICSQLDLWMVERAQPMTKVPKIVGLRDTQAASLLADSHLQYRGSIPKKSNEPAGTIIDQDPKPGTTEPWGYEVIAYKAVSPPASPSVSPARQIETPHPPCI